MCGVDSYLIPFIINREHGCEYRMAEGKSKEFGIGRRREKRGKDKKKGEGGGENYKSQKLHATVSRRKKMVERRTTVCMYLSV